MNFVMRVYYFIDRHLVVVILCGFIGLPILSSIFSSMEWGTIADWLSGIGSLAAVGVALYLSKEKPTIDFEIIGKDPIEFDEYGFEKKYAYKIKIKNYSNLGVRLQTLVYKIENHKYGVALTPCGIAVDDKINFIRNITVEVKKNTRTIVFYDVKSKKQFVLDLDEEEVTI